MTPLPKKKRSHSRQGKIRGQIKAELAGLTRCSNCQTVILPHHVCPNCGMYRGKMVLAPKTKITRIEKTGEEKT